MDKAQVMKLLRDIEWGIRVGDLDTCPSCWEPGAKGHHKNCKLAAVLNEEKRIVAIMGGGDWYDASVEHLVVPSGMDLNAEHRAYREWYHREYCTAQRAGNKMAYLGFSEWLIKQGAHRTADDEVLEFWET